MALCQYAAAVLAEWDTSEVLNCKIAEYTKAVLQGKPNFHISLIMNVSPECDCWGHNDLAIVPDLGMMASFDPVALDQACADLVNKAPVINGWKETPGNEDSASGCGCGCGNGDGDGNGAGTSTSCGCADHASAHGEELFKHIHPDTDWESGLQYAQEIGLGTREYELVEV